jgi:hypothetical protein
MVLRLWRGRGEWLGLVHDVNPEYFEGLIARPGIMDGAGRNLIGVAGLQLERRLAIGQKFTSPSST